MVCQTSAYRVLHEVPLDFEGEDGLILPTVDYVEEDVLKSPHGWIQVNNSLLVRSRDYLHGTHCSFSGHSLPWDCSMTSPESLILTNS
jgi:hypothetical protein